MINLQDALEQKKTALGIYNWLSWLSFLSVPWFLVRVFNLYHPSALEKLLAAVVPASPYLLVLLLAYGDNRIFVRRHVQQGFALVGLRAFTAFVSLNFGRSGYEGLWFFFLVNGLIWIIGRNSSRTQVNEGVGMFVRMPERLINRSVKDLQASLDEGEKLEDSTGSSVDPISEFARGEKLFASGRKNEASAAFVAAYRTGDESVRKLALRQLEILNQEDLVQPSTARASEVIAPVRPASEALAAAEDLLLQGDKDHAINVFSEAFRNGNQELRKAAFRRLDELGAVEEF